MSNLLIRTLVMVSWMCFATAALAQEIKPGASPAWVAGDTNAVVSLEVFNDYQCQACARFNERLKAIQDKHKTGLRTTFRNYPLTRTHENALLAAQAAEASGVQGKFFDMINQLYVTQKDWAEAEHARDLFISYAQVLKLDVYKFAADLDGDAVRQRIELDVERANSLKIVGTPTVLINGKMVPLATTDDEIENLIDRAVNASSSRLTPNNSVGPERRLRVLHYHWSGEGCVNSRRPVNSIVMLLFLQSRRDE